MASVNMRPTGPKKVRSVGADLWWKLVTIVFMVCFLVCVLGVLSTDGVQPWLAAIAGVCSLQGAVLAQIMLVLLGEPPPNIAPEEPPRERA